MTSLEHKKYWLPARRNMDIVLNGSDVACREEDFVLSSKVLAKCLGNVYGGAGDWQHLKLTDEMARKLTMFGGPHGLTLLKASRIQHANERVSA